MSNCASLVHHPVTAIPPIPQYLIKQNRPYNATDLQANLKAKHNISKPVVVKTLSALAAKGEIVEKTYGKQLIYGSKQPEVAADAEDLQNLKTETEALKQKLSELREALKDVNAEMAALESAPATSDLPKNIANLDIQFAKHTSRLEKYRANPSMMPNKADIATIDNNFNNVKKVWMQRRKAGQSMCDILTDAMQLDQVAAREWLEEEQGIEFDGETLELLTRPTQTAFQKKRKL